MSNIPDAKDNIKNDNDPIFSTVLFLLLLVGAIVLIECFNSEAGKDKQLQEFIANQPNYDDSIKILEANEFVRMNNEQRAKKDVDFFNSLLRQSKNDVAYNRLTESERAFINKIVTAYRKSGAKIYYEPTQQEHKSSINLELFQEAFQRSDLPARRENSKMYKSVIAKIQNTNFDYKNTGILYRPTSPDDMISVRFIKEHELPRAMARLDSARKLIENRGAKIQYYNAKKSEIDSLIANYAKQHGIHVKK